MEKVKGFYSESGQVNLVKQTLAYFICGILALLVGYIYSIFVIIMPFPLLNIPVVGIIAAILGLLCKLFVRFSESRSRNARLYFAITIGLIANYAQWITFVLYVMTSSVPLPGNFLSNLGMIIVAPGDFFSAIGLINRYGAWTIAGIPFNGFVLSFIWILEFGILMGGPIIGVLKTAIYPYSELLQTWYHKYTLNKDFESVVGVKQLTEDLFKDPLETINALGDGSGLRHTKIHLFYLKNEDKQYISFVKIFIKGQGRGNKGSTVLINNLEINKIQAEQILARYEHKRERLDVI